MKNLRIIAGCAGGLRIKSVPGDSTRPITDKVKEALFSIIGQDIVDSNFLDLFGGTGSVGIEALSRGANFTRFIEINHKAIHILKENLEYTKLLEYAEIIHADALKYIKQPTDIAFEYIFIAPPQYKELWLKTMQILDDNQGWLTEDGQIIVQIHPIEYKTLNLINFYEVEKREYGSTLIIFYERN